MITHISHVVVYATDQDEAWDFYTRKLGFETCTDAVIQDPKIKEFRWLTVRPKGQKNLEIVLMTPETGDFLDRESSEALQTLLKKGVLGAGVFYTNDCHGMYEELKARGVEFLSEPDEKPYGVIEAIFKDNSGNWFCLTQDVISLASKEPPRITHLSHMIVYTNNQERALAFYTQKLGCEMHTDAVIKDPKVKDFRWLTVTPKRQKDLEIVLMRPETGELLDEEASAALNILLEKGGLGAGVFVTTDCYGMSHSLKTHGVEFIFEPHEKPHGYIESVFRDTSGNWFCLAQEPL